MLARHAGRGTLTVYAEGSDGALFYLVYPHPNLNHNWDDWPQTQLVRRYPDGTQEQLYNYYPCTVYLDEVRWLVSQESNGLVAIRNLSTGEVRRARFGGTSVQISPHGNWAVYPGWGNTIYVVPVQ